MPFASKKILALFLLSLSAVASHAAGTFSLKTNADFPTMGADFGFKSGRFQGFVGMSNYSMRMTNTTTYSPEGSFNDNDTNRTSASVFITSIGFRALLRDEGLKPYFYANVYKLITIVDMSGNSKQEDDELEELYSPWGGGFGFGTEYPVSESFAIFGEYGFRMLFPNSEEKDSFGSGPGGSQRVREFSSTFGVLNGAAGIRFFF